MFSVRQLYDLQLLDWDIRDREQELAEVRSRLADDSARESARSTLEGLEARLQELGPARRSAEAAIQQLDERLAAIDNRVYSGVVTHTRELTAYQDEKVTLQRQRSAQEDTLLTILVDIEETQESRDRARESFESIDAHREKELVDLLASQETLTAELPRLHERRKSMVSGYPPHAMAVYDAISKIRGGHAVALVKRDSCQGCRIALARTELQAIRATQNIVQCGSCSRILVIT